MRCFKRAAGVALLTSLLLATVATLATASPKIVAPAKTLTPLTGTIDVTFSKGECTFKTNACWTCSQPVDLDLVRIDVDSSTISRDGLGIAPGCTGVIRLIEIHQQSSDGIKISGNKNQDVLCTTLSDCAHDLVIAGGTVDSSARYATTHQDCVQDMGGRRITFVGVIFSCSTANNAQFFITQNKQALVPTPPVDVVCNGCEFHPGTGFHSVSLEYGIRVGATNSLVCPAASQSLQYLIKSTVVNPIDVNNTKPWPASADPRCA